MIDWKHALFTIGFSAIAATRADRWLRWAARGSGVILMFHRVRPWREQSFAPNRSLEITPDFLDRVLTLLDEDGFDVVALDEVPARLEGRRTPRPFAALTFDDGYRDNLTYAWPILKRHGAPWALFIVSDFASRRSPPWWLELEEAIASLESFEVILDGEKHIFKTHGADEKYAAYHSLCQRLKAGPECQMRAVPSELAAQANLDLSQLGAEQCASWDEIAVLARDPNVTIGSHTQSHPILRRQNTFAVANEIKDSRSIIEERLGRPVRHLAYPSGDSRSVGPREFALARGAEYLTAVTTRPSHIWPRHADRLTALPRVSINGNYQTETAVRALLSGAPFMAWTAFLA
ncbi:polysaccharide deacetylase family protein [Methylocapsa aurea]|uniref:polysaccharide deacetylase family protein n=1 Tax=Methylocapsa aurea TaxID=663610 RepID=UPI0005655218|nr:polysaccharide deacetylase family protein [Methylocapsa aurea]